MPQYFAKDPDEVKNFTFDWSTWLDGDTISSDTVTVDSGLTKDSDTNDTDSVTVWVSGGTAGEAYKITSEIVTAAGNTEEDYIIVYVTLDGMMTFGQLVNRCAIALNDADYSTFTAQEINTWLIDAIQDYSQHFPRLKTQTISCGAADNDYDLNADFMGVLSVEYPTGQNPKEYLSRLSYTHADFWTGTKWYDILPRGDSQDPPELIISDDPAGTESIEVQYHAYHDLPAEDADLAGSCTVPVHHIQLLIKYVQWQAALQLMFAEQISPTSNSSLLMAQLSQNARRLEASYHTALRQSLYAADGVSKTRPWISGNEYSTQDSLARIY